MPFKDALKRPTKYSIFHIRLITILAWSVLAIIAAIWEYRDNRNFLTANALATARACINKDIVFRRWAAGHGGVYVPETAATPANPWLNLPERDIVTPSGRRLTLMNPAYMTRQIFEIGQRSANAPQGHITSLKPIRPENAPDPWEARALKSIETGESEFGEFQLLNGEPVYRYMHPLAAEKPCLKCHAVQGYHENDVRGGISIAIPMAGLQRSALQSNAIHMAIIAAIWMTGLIGIGIGFRKIGNVTNKLMAERDNLNSVFDATPMPMLLCDDLKNVVRVNSALRTYCSDYDTLRDKKCGTILKCVNASLEPEGCGNSPACDSCSLSRTLREVSRSGVPKSGEIKILRAGTENGEASEAWLLYGVEAVSLNGQVYTLMSFMDITKQKQEEEERRARAEEFRALVENSPDAIVRYDRNCRRIYVNPALERIAGKPASQLIGKTPFEEYIASPEIGVQIRDAVELVIEQGVATEIELSWKGQGGKMCYFQARFVAELGSDGVVASVLGIMQDITSLRKTEAQLLHAQKMESLGTLAGGVAHDFNNILAVIGGYAELLRYAIGSEDKGHGYVQEISASVVRGAELTRSLLALSGKHEPQKQTDNLNRIVGNLQKSMTRLVRSDISLNFRLCNEPLPIFADRIQIEQVLINLLVNARDALPAGGRIDLTTSLLEVCKDTVVSGATLAPGRYAVVTVADNGIGMNKETVENIFEPFFTTKETGKGTGLGLSIVFGIVANHNGRISVKSELCKGSEFGIYIPTAVTSAPVKQLPEPGNRELIGNETVLLVEDEPNVLRMNQEILMHYGYKVLTAVDGVGALEVFARHHHEIRIVVIDLIMPHLNGRETIEIIRQKTATLPIVLTSGYTDYQLDRSAIDTLGVIFLQKPVCPEKLAAALRTGLERTAKDRKVIFPAKYDPVPVS